LTPANDPSNPYSTGVQQYAASSSISSTRVVTGGVGTNVQYHAGSFILLIPGFEAKSATFFLANLTPCPD
jgi:hypothetical protein